MINDLGCHDKMDVNNVLDYASGSDTSSEVQNLEDNVDTIEKNIVVDDDTIYL